MGLGVGLLTRLCFLGDLERLRGDLDCLLGDLDLALGEALRGLGDRCREPRLLGDRLLAE